MRTLTITLLVTLFTACRTAKEKSIHIGASKQHTEAETHSAIYFWEQQDSNSRYWHYTSDTFFYYHPDRGLYANRGNLSIEEFHLKNTSQQTKDSSSYHYERNQSLAGTYWNSIKRRWMIWTLGFLAVVIFLIYRWRKD